MALCGGIGLKAKGETPGAAKRERSWNSGMGGMDADRK